MFATNAVIDGDACRARGIDSLVGLGGASYGTSEDLNAMRLEATSCPRLPCGGGAMEQSSKAEKWRYYPGRWEVGSRFYNDCL